MAALGPPVTATAMRQRERSTPVARATVWADSSSGSVRNGTHWQRDTMVGKMVSVEVPNRMNVTVSGGSSIVLSKAFAVFARICSARSMI